MSASEGIFSLFVSDFIGIIYIEPGSLFIDIVW
jgi:hypothetical protein